METCGMKIMITAGGTVEKIDSVRSISNISTGRLGSLIANTFSESDEVEDIYYLCGKSSLLPQSAKAKVFYIDSVASLEKMIINILNETRIDIIVHSMAVSDYRIKTATSLSDTIRIFTSKIGKLRNEQMAEPLLTDLFSMSLNETSIDNAGKISSNVESLLLLMEKTPKIISMFQRISPEAVLVGFKLMDNVPCETLIDTGFRLLQANKCSFVLANGLSGINENSHTGYLIDEEKNFRVFTTKKDIAGAIVAAAIEKRRNL
jgi:phosphopantothenate-cysteine ligase